jgi:hypothetical protein
MKRATPKTKAAFNRRAAARTPSIPPMATPRAVMPPVLKAKAAAAIPSSGMPPSPTPPPITAAMPGPPMPMLPTNQKQKKSG